MIVPLWADQLIPQLLMEQFGTLPSQCRHIGHMHEGVWFNFFFFSQIDSSGNLDNFFSNMAFVYAWIVPTRADQVLPQLLLN